VEAECGDGDGIGEGTMNADDSGGELDYADVSGAGGGRYECGERRAGAGVGRGRIASGELPVAERELCVNRERLLACRRRRRDERRGGRPCPFPFLCISFPSSASLSPPRSGDRGSLNGANALLSELSPADVVPRSSVGAAAR
jgi:hypothetical protein